MDYTTVDLVKEALRISESGDDTLLARVVTAASRSVDRYCTGTGFDSDDYFALGTVTHEILSGYVDLEGRLIVWPRKPLINSVSSMEYRRTPLEAWVLVDSDRIEVSLSKVTTWVDINDRKPRAVRLTYVGGLAAEVGGLPADLVEAVTLLAARYYKEAEASLSDAIGVPELGTLMFTKAMPIRVFKLLEPYKRVVGW